MFLSAIIALVAVSISSIAAYYSIAGLAAIFSASVIPIIIMGIVLEVGKLASVVWLHRHWKMAATMLKLYLIPAVLVLMLITSMGIFGFLSKAHIEQTVTVGDTKVQVQNIDDQIAREQARIKQSQTVLDQLDAAVDTLIKYDRIRGKDGSIATRERQKKERDTLAAIISDAQDKISVLQAERAKLAAEQVKLEAEVGPIKYVAALIYGDGVTAERLDNSVRWMIIIIVSVFDPLAIILVLAASSSYTWAKEGKNKSPSVKLESELQEASAQIDRLEGQLSEAEAALAEAEQARLSSDDSETVAELQEIIKTLEEELVTARSDVADACNAAEEVVRELDELKASRAKNQSEEVTELLERLDRVKKSRENDKEASNRIIAEKNLEITQLREKIATLEESLKEATVMVSALKKSSERVLEDKQRINDSSIEKDKTIADLQKKKEQAEQELVKYVEEKKQLENELLRLKNQPPIYVIDNEAVQNQVEAAMIEYRNQVAEEHKTAISIKDAEIQNLRSKLNALIAQIG